jgi:hypothetical protein
MSTEDKKIKELKNKIKDLESSLNYHRRLIKDAWWMLTDINAHDLNMDIHIRAVSALLSGIA